MERKTCDPRPDWVQKVEEKGLLYHSLPDGGTYWAEGTYYQLTSKEVDKIEAATAELWDLCIKAGDQIVAGRWRELGIPEAAMPAIRKTWEEEPPALYGRFDLAYDGEHIKMLEFNADTPTSLLEASVIQWFWLQDVFPSADQFNSLHEKLIAKWKDLDPYLAKPLYFAHSSYDATGEDLMTVTYLADTASEAGIEVRSIAMEELGWDGNDHQFISQGRDPVTSIFKLYPWEWMLAEPFGAHALQQIEQGKMTWIEPIWKMIWSNKGILPVLWEMNKGHELLLETHFDGPRGMRSYVSKPMLAREGANVQVFLKGCMIANTEGTYEGARVYQELAGVGSHYRQAEDGEQSVSPIIGSWVIDGVPAGMGIREADGRVTDNRSRFVPHLFR